MPCRPIASVTGCGIRGVAHWQSFCENQVSVTFKVDIHPAAKIGRGIMLDHATGIVVGETAVIENDVSILQSVTLGGTGKSGGDRRRKFVKV